MKNILSIAGSDPSGGAGIQADLKTFSALGCYGMAAITALTAQNTIGVRGVHIPPADFLAQQLDAIFEDIHVDAVKIGMAGNAQTIHVIAAALKTHKPAYVVLDPVMVATSGDVLLQDDAIAALKSELLPLADIITPNFPEAEILTGMKQARAPEELTDALLGLDVKAVFLKGGHGKGDESNDLFLSAGTTELMKAPRINTKNTHGTGCTLSAAIAAYLARGKTPIDACRKAKAYLHEALRHADELQIGSGSGPVHHFWKQAD